MLLKAVRAQCYLKFWRCARRATHQTLTLAEFDTNGADEQR